MPINDPRRVIASSVNRDNEVFGPAKTLGLMGIVSITGIKLGMYFEDQRNAVQYDIDRARYQTEKAALIFSDETVFRSLSKAQGPESVVSRLSSHYYDPGKTLRQSQAAERSAPPITELAPAEIHDDLLKMADTIDRLHDGTDNMTREQASEAMARNDARGRKALSKEYPTMLAALNEVDGITVTRIRDTGTTINVRITDGTTTDVIRLPKWTSGVIEHKGVMYRPNLSASAHSRMVVGGHFGTNVASRIPERIGSPYFGAVNKVRELVTIVSDAVGSNVQDHVDGNSLTALVTARFTVTDVSSIYDGAPTPGKVEALGDIARLVEKNQIQIRTDMGLKKVNQLFPVVPYLSVSAISEEAFTNKFKLSTPLPFGIWPMVSRAKASQQRGNFISGHFRHNLRYSSTELASRLGPMPIDTAKHLSKHLKETVPGKYTNVIAFNENIRMKSWGKGGALFLINNMLDPKGEMTGKNIDVYSGTRTRVHRIPLTYSTRGDNVATAINEDIRSLVHKLDDKLRRGQPTVLKMGEWLGEAGTYGAIKLEENELVLKHEVIGGELVIETQATRELGVGTKVDQGKVMVLKVLTTGNVAEQFSKSDPIAGVMGKLMSVNRIAQLAPELLVNSDQITKMSGGGVGWGLIQKTMTDLIQLTKLKIQQADSEASKNLLKVPEMRKAEKALREVLRTFMGASIDNDIKKIGIAPSTHMPYIFLQGWDKVQDGIMSSVSSASENAVMDVENAYTKAMAGDFRPLERYARKVDEIFKTHGLPQYNMIETIDLGKMENESRRLMTKLDQYFPSVVRTLVSKAKGRPMYEWVSGVAQVAMGVHQQSAHDFATFGSFNREFGGFQGGFKLTRDHIEIAMNSGWEHYTRYLNMLYDHDLSYVSDKMFTAERRFLGPKADFRKVPNSFVKVSGISMITQSMMRDPKTNISSRLAQLSVSAQAAKDAGRYRIHGAAMSAIQGKVDDAAYAELLDQGFFTESDLRATSHVTKGKYSVDLTPKALVDDIINLFDRSAADEAVYMELPETILIEGKEVKAIPIDKFHLAEMFELEAHRTPDGQSMDRQFFHRFTTGDAIHTNRMSILKEIGRISEELVSLKKHKRDTSHLKVEMAKAVERYYARLDELTTGSKSPFIKNLLTKEAPFSMRGIAHNLSVGDRVTRKSGSRSVVSIEGLPTDSMYVSEDTGIKLLSGGQVESVSHAKEIIYTIDSIKDTTRLLKGMPLGPLTDQAADELTETVVKLGRSFRNMNETGRELVRKQVALDLIGLGKEAERGKDLSKILTSKGDREHFTRLIKELKESRLMAAETDKMIPDNLKRVEDLYRDALDKVQKIRSGTLEVGGMLVGSPEISQMSMTHLKLKMIGSNEFAQNVANKNVIGNVNELEKMLRKGAMFVSKEVLEAINRDLDQDPIGFITTTLDTLDKQSNDVTKFNLLKEMKILGESGNDLRRAMLQDLNDEFVVNHTLERLTTVATDDQGKLMLQRPASISSITMMDSLSRHINEGRVDTSNIYDYVSDMVKKLYPDEAVKARTGANTHDAVAKKITQLIEEGAKRFLGTEATLENLRVVTATRETENKSIRKVVEQPDKPIKDLMNFAKEFPERLPEAMHQAESDEATRLWHVIHNMDKEAFEAYQNRIVEEESQRFHIIKSQTPDAFNISKQAIYALNFRYITEEKDKAFAIWIADKMIAQNVISAKHGNPQVLTDLRQTLRRIGTASSEVLEKDLDNLARGNLVLTTTKAEKNEIARFTNATELGDVDMDSYQNYLEKRYSALATLDDLHKATTAELLEKLSVNQWSVKETEEAYRKSLDGRIQNSSNLKSYQLPTEYYSQHVTSMELARAGEATKTMSKFRSEWLKGIVGDASGRVDEAKSRWKVIIGAMKEFAWRHKGHVLDDDAIKAFRAFDSRDTPMLGLMKKLIDKETIIKGDASDVVRINAGSALESFIARKAALISGVADTHRTIIGGDTVEDRKMRLRFLQQREIRAVQRGYAERMADQTTMFRPGSMINTLERRTLSASTSAVTDALEKKVGKMKGAGLLIGMMAGTILGQSMNQITNGYAIPDLRGTANGLGGEYYEKRNRYLGREIELFMGSPKARITSNSTYDRVADRELASIGDAQATVGTNVNVRSMMPYLRGSVVR